MKKITLFSIAISSVLFLSCRQNEDILSNEDIETLNIIQKNRNLREAANASRTSPFIKAKTDTLSRTIATDDAIKPPKL